MFSVPYLTQQYRKKHLDVLHCLFMTIMLLKCLVLPRITLYMEPLTRLDSSGTIDSTRLDSIEAIDSTRLVTIRKWNDLTRPLSDSTRLVTRPVGDSLQHCNIILSNITTIPTRALKAISTITVRACACKRAQSILTNCIFVTWWR